MTDRMKKMVDGSLPNGTLIRACEGTFDYLEKQDDRIAKLEAALRDLSDGRECCPVSQAMRRVARKALDAE